MKTKQKRLQRVFKLLVLFLFTSTLNNQISAEFTRDVYLKNGDIFSNKKNIQIDNKARIYATVRNNSNQDISGTATFFDKTENKQLSSPKVFSAISNKSDDVFVDFIPTIYGNHQISVTIKPNDPTQDNPVNNNLTTQVFVDYDTDKDGILNSQDPDIDNDTVLNEKDAFPTNFHEAYDTDRDGVGNNADIDDDNDGLSDKEEKSLGTSPYKKDSDQDGVNDKEDLFPLNKNEQLDFDKDGLGDNEDLDDDNDNIPDGEDLNPRSPAPKIIIDFPEQATLNTLVNFSAEKSTVGIGKITKIQWFFEEDIKTGLTTSHTFTTPGDKKLFIKAFNEKGETTEKVFFITITQPWKYQILWILLIVIIAFYLGRAMQAKLDQYNLKK